VRPTWIGGEDDPGELDDAEEDECAGLDGVDETSRRGTPAGASTTHFPSVCVSATRSTFRPHCSRILLSLFSSIQPCGTSIARVVRVVITVSGGSYASGVEDGDGDGSRLVAGPEIISSVAPTLQCAGYTGMAYASTNL
jgi:hypothetical protein